MFDVITIGSATQDVFLTSKDYTLISSKKFSTGVGECFAFGSKIEVKNIFFDTGGGATNTAVTFRNLGFRVAVCARIGDDAPGREILSVLRSHGVDRSLLFTATHQHTAYSSILLTAMGERTVLVHRGASAHFSVREIPWKKMRTRWLYISSLGGNMAVLKKLFAHAKKEGIAIAWNPGNAELAHGYKALYSFIAATGVFILNREEANALVGFHPESSEQIVAITDGKRGAYVYDHGEQFFAPSTGHKPVNTTGAGDAFGSAFVAGVMKGLATVDALRLGILNSGLVVTKMGAKNGLLSRMPSKKMLQNISVRMIF